MIRAALVSLLLLLPFAAKAQMTYSDVVKELRDSHNERVISQGISMDGNLYQIFASPNGSTWTLIILTPDGRTFIPASGTDWARMVRCLKGDLCL